MARKPAKARAAGPGPGEVGQKRLTILEIALLSVCLSILALRVTYTEGPTAQMLLMPGSLVDTVYSLTLSGLLIFAFVLCLLWRVLANRFVYRATGIEIGLFLFTVAAIVSTIGASDKRAAITYSMMLLGPLCAALLLAQILDSSAKIRVVLVAVAALGIVSAYQCAEQFFVSNTVTIEQYEKHPQLLLGPLGIEAGTFQHFLFEHRLYSRGIRGFFTTSNSAASFAIMASFAAVALLVRGLQDARSRQRGLRSGLFLALAIFLLVAGLFLTQSKGGILAFCAGLAVFAVLMGIHRWLGAHKRLATAVFGASILLLVAVVGFATVRYGLKHDRLPGGNSMLVRWQYWAASAQMYADHPLTGVGPGNFADYYSRYKPAPALESVSDPHSFLLSLMTQYGPLGLLGFLMMVCGPLWRSAIFPARTEAADEAQAGPPFRPLALITLSVIGACLLLVRPLLIPVTGAGDAGVMLYEIITLYLTAAAAFLIGYLLAAAPLEDRRPWQTDLSSAALSAALISALLAVLLHNLIDFAIFEPGVWLTFWILIACLAAMRLQRSSRHSFPAKSAAVLKAAALGTALVLFVSYLCFVWKPAYETTVSIQQAQRAASAGRFDRAHRLLDTAMSADPLSPVIPNVSGRLYLLHYEKAALRQPGLLEEAARCFRRAIEANPADYKNYEKLALVYGQLGEKHKTYDWYLKAVQLYPGSDRLWFGLAQAAERLGLRDAALSHYQKAVEIEDSYRRQFRQMYPQREKIVSRLGEQDYRLARKRIEELSR